MKFGVIIALIAGLVAAVYLIWVIGFGAVFAAVARAGMGGLLLLCLCSLAVTVALSAGLVVVLPPAQRLPHTRFFLARLVREAIAEISPFSPVGGLVAAARLAMLYGMKGAYAAASVAADMTTEAMAQVPFLAFGVMLSLGRIWAAAAKRRAADRDGGGAAAGGARHRAAGDRAEARRRPGAAHGGAVPAGRQGRQRFPRRHPCAL